MSNSVKHINYALVHSYFNQTWIVYSNAKRFHREEVIDISICFLGPHVWHVEVPRLGVEWELQLPAYTTATATQHPSRI